MARSTRKKSGNESGGATVGYEARLWQMADALRGSMDAAEYKHVCLGLLFLKYISDAFEERHAALLIEQAEGADPEDPDEYRAQNIFWVPPEARWARLKAQARQPTIGQLVDDAMAGIERDNPSLKGVLPKDYARPALDKQRFGQLIDTISNIQVGDEASRAKDVLGRVYEYFLSQFASAEGKKGGEFYTPHCVGQAAGGNARTVSRARVRPVLRFVGNVRTVGGVHPRSRDGQWQPACRQAGGWQREGRYLDLRPGVELHHLAARAHEPCDPRYRLRADRAGRHLS